MFSQLKKGGSRKSLIVSLAVHASVIALILVSRPQFIQPSSIAFGNSGRGTSENVVYLGEAAMPPRNPLRVPVPKAKALRKKSEVAKPSETPVDSPVESARAGSSFGSLTTGPRAGYESRPALPVVFPNPAVDRSDIPSGVAGDVIVEVTIDEKGNVADAKVLESLGYGLEEKVLEALKNWRFTPATMNGVAIASRQDVHFHFPS